MEKILLNDLLHIDEDLVRMVQMIRLMYIKLLLNKLMMDGFYGINIKVDTIFLILINWLFA